MMDAHERITKDGATLTARALGLLEAASAAAGVAMPRVLQGSFSGGKVAASAGTHDGGGAFDLSVRGLTIAQQLALVTELRRRGACAWVRSPAYGWTSTGPHIHGIVRSEPDLSAGAAAQVVAYDRGLNGLASRRKDPHARPKQLPYMWPAIPEFPGPYEFGMGARGEHVRLVQLALGLTADGWFGPRTLAAVKGFQRTRPWSWPADGLVGPKTFAALAKKVI